MCAASQRLSVLVRLVGEESRERESGRELVLTRLVEVMLIEALRSTSNDDAPPGLLRGLADARRRAAMRQMHGDPARSWTVEQLAKKAALSRSAFFERFTRSVGLPPMEYLLAWRMALAKDLLRRQALGIAEVAERVGYGSASTFSTAFSRHVGQPPGRYARRAEGSHSLTSVASGRWRRSLRMRRSVLRISDAKVGIRPKLEVSLQGSWRFGRPGLCGQTCCGRSRLGRLLRVMKGR